MLLQVLNSILCLFLVGVEHANALQEHFTLPYENEQPIPLTIPKEMV